MKLDEYNLPSLFREEKIKEFTDEVEKKIEL